MISDININNGSRRSMFQRTKNALKTHWLLLLLLLLRTQSMKSMTLAENAGRDAS